MATSKNTGLDNEVKNALMAHFPEGEIRRELGEALSAQCGSRKAGADIATRANDYLHRVARAFNLQRGIDAGVNVRLPGTRKAHVVALIARTMVRNECSATDAVSAVANSLTADIEGAAGAQRSALVSSADVFS